MLRRTTSIQGLVRLVDVAEGSDGHQWLITFPMGLPLPAGPASVIVRHMRELATVIGDLHRYANK